MRFLDFSAPSGKCQASGCTFPKRAAAAARDQAALHSSAAAGRLHRSGVQGTVVPPRHHERSAPAAVLSGIRPRFARRCNRAFRGWKRIRRSAPTPQAGCSLSLRRSTAAPALFPDVTASAPSPSTTDRPASPLSLVFLKTIKARARQGAAHVRCRGSTRNWIIYDCRN